MSSLAVRALCSLVVTAVVGLAPLAPAAAADPYEPPSETVQTPVTDDCAQRDRPPPPLDTSEDLPPGVPQPDPLPVPERPVGGERLGECGFVLPDAAPPLPSDITAGAWLIGDLDSGEVLAAKDPHGRYRPASTLKLLTMLVMLRNLPDLEQVVAGTSTDSAQEGSRVGIGEGGQYTVRQLLLFLMMGSGNDVANALARANGGFEKSVTDLNAAAASVGALDTRAATVDGLDRAGQSSSAYDLAVIAKADLALPAFREFISTKYSEVPPCCGEPGFGIASDNQLLFQYPGAIGGKTGFTDDAGNTYVGLAERDGRRLVVTMLDGTQRPRRQWMQAASLLDWGFALPAGTAPVGQLVGSLAEATAAPAPPSTPSAAPPPAAGSDATATVESTPGAASGAPTETTTTIDTAADTAGTSSNGALVAVLVSVVVLAGAAVVAVLLRRRKRQTATASASASTAPAPAAEGD